MVELVNSMILAIKQDQKETLRNLFDIHFESKKYYLQIPKYNNCLIPLQPLLFDISVSLHAEKCKEYIHKYPIKIKKQTSNEDLDSEYDNEESENESIYEDCESRSNSDDDCQRDLMKITLKTDKIIQVEDSDVDYNLINYEKSELPDNFSSLTSWFLSSNFAQKDYPETVYECFYLAANNNILSIVEYLLIHGIDATRISKYGTIVYNSAVFKENYDLIDLLHQYEVEQTADNHRRTPLHIAVKTKNVEMVNYLLEMGADPTARDWRGWAPIHVAAKLGLSDIINSFYNYGFDINHRTKSGITPLHMASAYGKINVCETLYQLGAEMEPIEKRGFTPMNFASHHKKKKVIQFFDSLGINNTNIDPEYHQKHRQSKSKSKKK